MDDVIQIITPAPDSHYLLLPCPECMGDNVAYVQYMTGIQEPWKVACFDCGCTVDRQKIFKHEAQVAWNKNANGETYDGNNQKQQVQPVQRVSGQVLCLF